MISPTVYWKTAIDFRDFDISVPSFTFQNNISRNVDGYMFDDQITLVAAPGSAQNNSFLGTGITRSGQTITSGTLNMYVDNRSGGFDGYILISGNPSASALNAVMDSASLTDDLAYLRSQLSGADTMILSGSGVATNDYAFGAGGFDNIYGGGGADTLLGDSGNDYINGDAGRDSLIGGTQNDTLNGGLNNDNLSGGKGADELNGDAGADRLSGDAGNDTLAGGTGADIFVFKANQGNDTIVDWEDNVDKIRLEPTVNISVSIDYSGPDALITIAAMNLTILVENVANGSLTLSHQGNVFFLT
jgi:Ca2+-binding RTX toxin-like protein